MKQLGWVGVCGVLVLGVATAVVAEPKGKGRGASESPADHAKKASERVANEAIDAVADELTGTPPSRTIQGLPPGLAKKGKMPPGLARQNKTPPGWEKGKKTGWDGESKQESWIRRAIRGIFGKKKAPDEQHSN